MPSADAWGNFRRCATSDGFSGAEQHSFAGPAPFRQMNSRRSRIIINPDAWKRERRSNSRPIGNRRDMLRSAAGTIAKSEFRLVEKIAHRIALKIAPRIAHLNRRGIEGLK